MTALTLDQARGIISAAQKKGAELGLNPLTVVVLDAGGHMIAMERQDGSSFMRPQVAHGKAYGALAMGLGSRALFNRAQEQAYFINAVNALAGGALVPVPGGVLIRDGQGELVGAVGISGDTSDQDETAAVAGIESQGLTAVTGG